MTDAATITRDAPAAQASPAEPLFQPYRLGPFTLQHRIVMAPLTRTRAQNRGKIPNELMAEYYAQRAGAGLIVTEGTFVSEQGQGWYGAPGIYNAEQAAGWRRVTNAVHSAGGLMFTNSRRPARTRSAASGIGLQ